MQMKIIKIYKITLTSVLIVMAILSLALAANWYVVHGHPLVRFAMGYDWFTFFVPAAKALIEGKSPYHVDGFFNPPWTLVPVSLIQYFGGPLGFGLMAALNLAAWTLVFLRLGRSDRWGKIALLPFLLFGGPLLNSFYGNLDGLVALGLILPRRWGLLLLLMKPQLGLPVVLYWCVDEFRVGGLGRVVKLISPGAELVWMAVMVYGFWFLKSEDVVGAVWNSSLWPWGVPVGLVFLGLAIWKRKPGWAVMAAPFLTPYLAWHSWAFLWMGIGMVTSLDAHDKLI
jgi:hypothetical protein